MGNKQTQDYINEQVRKWTKKHKELNDSQWEKKQERERQWRMGHKKHLSERSKSYYLNNKDKISERTKERYKNNINYRMKILERKRLRNEQNRLKLRFTALNRDNFTCQYCGKKVPEVILEIDHRFPKSKGGLDKIENYITSCRDCNLGKGDCILNEFKN